jgi:predicted nucleotidyltransferase
MSADLPTTSFPPPLADLDRRWLADFCQTHRIRRLSLFGSALTGPLRESSDIDLLVEFDPEAAVSLFDVGGMMHELSQKLGRQVDLRTPDDLSRYFRDQVRAEAMLLYAA